MMPNEEHKYGYLSEQQFNEKPFQGKASTHKDKLSSWEKNSDASFRYMNTHKYPSGADVLNGAVNMVKDVNKDIDSL